MLSGIVFSLFPLIVLGAAIIVVVAAVRRRGADQGEPGIGTLRRVFLYVLSLAGLIAAAMGVVLVLRSLLDALFSETFVSIGDTTLALGLALTIVGTPVWLGFWWLAYRASAEYPAEVRSLARKLYLHVVLTGAAVTASISAILFSQWLLGTGDFSGTPLALTLVWGSVWAYHWRVQEQEGQLTEVTATVRRLSVYIVSLFGLIALSVGVVTLLKSTLSAAYRALFGAPDLVLGERVLWDDVARASVAMIVVGAVVWWWHWHRAAREDIDSDLRSVYLYLFTILGGAATLIVSLSIILYRLLQWWVGVPEATSLVEQFSVLPATLAAAVVGASLWGYYWNVAKQEAAHSTRGASTGQRVYSYLVSAVGLVTLGVGLTILFSDFLGLLSVSGPSLGGGLWRNPLVLSITLLAVGVPVWWIFWNGVQRTVLLGTSSDRAALSRRLFIYGTFGISVLLTLVNLSIVLFNVFDVILGARSAGHLLWDSRWSLSILLTAGAISGYYWFILQEDRRAMAEMPEAEAPREAAAKHVTLLTGDASLSLARELENRLGHAVTVWRRPDGVAAPAPSREDWDQVEQAIAEAASDRVIVVVEQDGIRVIPYVVT